MPWYWADYLADTPNLSLAEHGAYCLLLAYCYKSGGRLVCSASCERIENAYANASVSHASLHRLCRCQDDGERWAVDAVLRQYFVLDGQTYSHPRVTKEMAKRAEKKQKASESAEKRWDKKTRRAMRSHPERIEKDDANPMLATVTTTGLLLPPKSTGVLGGERTGAPPLPADFQTGKGPSQKTRQAMEWVQNKIDSTPDAVKDMRNQDRGINRAIQLCGEWTKLSAALRNPVTAPDARAEFMRAFAAACREADDEKASANG